jgi:drug/metabolite transporter (DMT)-like permease/DNA-binding PadR family transcriptional regulator
VSGVLYGLYGAFVSGAQATGPWAGWFAGDGALSAFTQVYVLGMLACGVNDALSALWALGLVGIRGKLADFWRCLRSKPGLVMVACAVIGGPIANGAYLIALRMAGPSAATITALCPVVGAVIGRVVFKQKISARMAAGIAICLAASLMIASTSLGADAPPTMALGLLIALVAAVGWGIEGSVAGYGTVLIDYEIGIAIRQLTSGALNLAVFVPLLAVMAGDGGLYGTLLGQAVADGPSVALFGVAGLFSCLSFGLWYKGNAMCGTALGMACNGSYSFWTPLMCWLVLGIGFGQPGWAVAPIVWVAAPVLFIGLLLIAANPFALFRARDGGLADDAAPRALVLPSRGAPAGGRTMPLNYALLAHLALHGEADVDSLMDALSDRYGGWRAFRRPLVADALAAAEKNGVLEARGLSLAGHGAPAIRYRPTPTGQAMIERFLLGGELSKAA